MQSYFTQLECLHFKAETGPKDAQCAGYNSSFLGTAVHVVDVHQVAVQVAPILHLQGERAVAKDAHVTL